MGKKHILLLIFIFLLKLCQFRIAALFASILSILTKSKFNTRILHQIFKANLFISAVVIIFLVTDSDSVVFGGNEKQLHDYRTSVQAWCTMVQGKKF